MGEHLPTVVHAESDPAGSALRASTSFLAPGWGARRRRNWSRCRPMRASRCSG